MQFKAGDRVRLDAPGKPGHGSDGSVVQVTRASSREEEHDTGVHRDAVVYVVADDGTAWDCPPRLLKLLRAGHPVTSRRPKPAKPKPAKRGSVREDIVVGDRVIVDEQADREIADLQGEVLSVQRDGSGRVSAVEVQFSSGKVYAIGVQLLQRLGDRPNLRPWRPPALPPVRYPLSERGFHSSERYTPSGKLPSTPASRAAAAPARMQQGGFAFAPPPPAPPPPRMRQQGLPLGDLGERERRPPKAYPQPLPEEWRDAPRSRLDVLLGRPAPRPTEQAALPLGGLVTQTGFRFGPPKPPTAAPSMGGHVPKFSETPAFVPAPVSTPDPDWCENCREQPCACEVEESQTAPTDPDTEERPRLSGPWLRLFEWLRSASNRIGDAAEVGRKIDWWVEIVTTAEGYQKEYQRGRARIVKLLAELPKPLPAPEALGPLDRNAWTRLVSDAMGAFRDAQLIAVDIPTRKPVGTFTRGARLGLYDALRTAKKPIERGMTEVLERPRPPVRQRREQPISRLRAHPPNLRKLRQAYGRKLLAVTKDFDRHVVAFQKSAAGYFARAEHGDLPTAKQINAVRESLRLHHAAIAALRIPYLKDDVPAECRGSIVRDTLEKLDAAWSAWGEQAFASEYDPSRGDWGNRIANIPLSLDRTRKALDFALFWARGIAESGIVDTEGTSFADQGIE